MVETGRGTRKNLQTKREKLSGLCEKPREWAPSEGDVQEMIGFAFDIVLGDALSPRFGISDHLNSWHVARGT
jgi:hypothetical protein